MDDKQWTVFLSAEHDSPAYDAKGNRTNEVTGVHLKIYGNAIASDLYFTIIGIYDQLEEAYGIPREKAKVTVEQLERLRDTGGDK